MNSERFDRWARTIGSRRAALRGLTGGVLAVLVGQMVPQDDVTAARRCPAGKKRCRGRCIPRRRCCTTSQCPRGSGKVCRGGRCLCPAGTKLCGAQCIPVASCCTATDCLAGQTCYGGTCGPTSPSVLNSADPLWAPCGTSTGLRYFETHTFSWPGGPFEATMTAQGFAAWLFLYRAPEFNPALPCVGRQTGDASTGGPGGVAVMRVDNLPPGQYALIATNVYGGSDPRPVTGTFAIGYGPRF